MFTMNVLTKKQKNIFDYVAEYQDGKGYPPTIREIGQEFGITAKGAYDHLKAIERKGYIRCHKHLSRAIEILKPTNINHNSSSGMLSIPLVGQIAAGVPITAEENIEEYITFPRSMVQQQADNLFALRVTGDSMKDAGVFDGDIAIIRKQATADNGDIIVALLDE